MWLKAGTINSAGWLFVNSRPAGSVYSYCGTYKFDVTDLVDWMSERNKTEGTQLKIFHAICTAVAAFCTVTRTSLLKAPFLLAKCRLYCPSAVIRKLRKGPLPA